METFFLFLLALMTVLTWRTDRTLVDAVEYPTGHSPAEKKVHTEQ